MRIILAGIAGGIAMFIWSRLLLIEQLGAKGAAR
jgi:hypothetical protein